MTAIASGTAAAPSTAPPPGPPWLWRAAVLNLVVQVGIVVTGGIVRLTGSGLGCPTWPECAPGSLVPTPEQTEGVAKLIEFGNRLLTFVVGLAALAVLVLAWRYRRRLLPLAALPLIGTLGQAALGGYTVLTALHPATVAAHFLLSMVLIAASTLLLQRIAEPDGRVTARVAGPLRALAWSLAVVGALTLVLGTVVTGSGPHSGDADEPVRFAVDPRTASMLHADAVLLFCGLLVGYLVAVRLMGLRGRPWVAGLALLGVTLAQGAIGYAQYFTGLPRVLVVLHMLGASLFVVSLTAVVLATRTREGHHDRH